MNGSTLQSRGVIDEVGADSLVLTIPGTEYRLGLTTRGQVGGAWLTAGKKARGVIRVNARRIDVVTTGGRYIEPVYGAPRRFQGTIIAIDVEANTVAIRAADSVVFVCTPSGGKRATDFSEGALVATDILPPGAEFEAIR